MQQHILKELQAHYDITTPYGCFLSLFDEKNQLLESHGSLETTKSLKDFIATILGVLTQKHTPHVIMIDIVTKVVDINIGDINQYNPQERGLYLASLDGSQHGCLLPQTAGVQSLVQAYNLIKQKNNLTDPIVLSVFETQRHHVSV